MQESKITDGLSQLRNEIHYVYLFDALGSLIPPENLLDPYKFRTESFTQRRGRPINLDP